MSKIEIGYVVKPQIDKGDLTDNCIIKTAREAMVKAIKILNTTYRPAGVTELTMIWDHVTSTRLVDFKIEVVAG